MLSTSIKKPVKLCILTSGQDLMRGNQVTWRKVNWSHYTVTHTRLESTQANLISLELRQVLSNRGGGFYDMWSQTTNLMSNIIRYLTTRL